MERDRRRDIDRGEKWVLRWVWTGCRHGYSIDRVVERDVDRGVERGMRKLCTDNGRGGVAMSGGNTLPVVS